ncbi:MAG: NAD(P)H-hydrate epimerase [Caldilineae bacterium]|nr:MAG: NAD(P)H-hydrate epimerase [Caldilineae bacterium]
MKQGFPVVPVSQVPLLTTEQMREVDRLMIEEYGILLVQMMENAGRNLADLAQVFLDDEVQGRGVLVLAGRGNNGGGGLAAARHLANRGAEVQVVLSHDMETYAGVPAQQLHALLQMGIPVMTAERGWELPPADLLLDALIGYGLRGHPRGAVAELIRLAGSHPAPLLALDAPSGLDTTTGVCYEPHIRAQATLTLALPKAGLVRAPKEMVGELYVSDISVPPGLYQALGVDVGPLFARARILQVDL